MTTRLILIFMFSAVPLLIGGERVATIEIAALIKEQTEIRVEEKKLASFEGNEADKKKRVEFLNTRRKQMYRRVRELKPLLEKGRSVFDYDGLLALGKVSYKERARVYELYISTGRNGLGPSHLYIVFERDGKIRRVHHLALVS